MCGVGINVRHIYVTIILVVFAALVSCNSGSSEGGSTKADRSSLPSVTGRNGEVLVVINDDVKRDTSGVYLRAMLTESFVGLSAPEPLFDMTTIPAAYLDNLMKTFRNMLVVEVDASLKSDTVHFYNDVWAYPQAYVLVQSRSKAALLKTLQDNHIKILSYLVKSERDRLISYDKKIKNVALSDEIGKKWGIEITVPNLFTRCKPVDSNDLSWVRIDTDEYQCALMVYDFPYIGEGSLSKEYILDKRDKLLRKNVGGPAGSYMCTEIRYGLDEIVYKSGTHNGMQVAELRGLWRMEGYAMGGPFVLRAHYDAENSRVIVTDGYVYYPSREKKRNLLRQLEAIMYTIQVKGKDTSNQN